jgi:5-methylcytosine-specific restriction endonuclease McrA
VMLFKPRAQALDRHETRMSRRQKMLTAKRKAAADHQAAERAIRAAVWGRDKGRCRACQIPVELRSDNPFRLMHAHHLVFRSAGGGDELDNRLSLCGKCHDDVHRHVLNVEGNPNQTVSFTQIDYTGDIHSIWSSPCPS